MFVTAGYDESGKAGMLAHTPKLCHQSFALMCRRDQIKVALTAAYPACLAGVDVAGALLASRFQTGYTLLDVS
jgi:hypothetical protein